MTLENRMGTTRFEEALFTIGDYVAGGAVGAATAAAVRAVLSPQLDMVVAMLLGMAIGMLVHLVLSLLLSPVLGAFHAMVPGSLIGMYGGMLFAMRDTMQTDPGSLSNAVQVGAVFGVIVTAGVRLYDRAIRGTTPSDVST
jgi:hypothetical protein